MPQRLPKRASRPWCRRPESNRCAACFRQTDPLVNSQRLYRLSYVCMGRHYAA